MVLIEEFYYLNLSARDIQSQSVNISWFFHISSIFDAYNLTVIGSNTQRLQYVIDEPYYLFTAPEDAPPCEVYNFSVTATYGGATYTGAGCSVPSPVLSRMLPSLPDATRFKSSLNYTLEKNITEERITLILFNVFIMVYKQFIISACMTIKCNTLMYIIAFQLFL